jgi:hypothetical protein
LKGSILRDDAAGLHNEAAAFASGGGFGEGGRLDCHEIGRPADLQSIILEAQHTSRCRRHHVERQRQLLVVAEVGAVGDLHGAVEHVAVAEG